MKAITLNFFIVALTYSSSVFSQQYISDLQIDYTLSGKTKIGMSKAYISFLEDQGLFLVKFENLENTQVFDISFFHKKENEDHYQTIYLINDNFEYGGLKLAEYKTAQEFEGVSYDRSFTLIGMAADGTIAYSTTFIVKPR